MVCKHSACRLLLSLIPLGSRCGGLSILEQSVGVEPSVISPLILLIGSGSLGCGDTQVPTLPTLLRHQPHVAQLIATAQLVRSPVQVLKCCSKRKDNGSLQPQRTRDSAPSPVSSRGGTERVRSAPSTASAQQWWCRSTAA